jgi:hypothetical protein
MTHRYQNMNLNNKQDPISRLYLKLSREDRSKAYLFSNLISDFETDVTIRTNDIDRIKNASNKDNITILTDRDDINSAITYCYEDAKQILVKDFESMLNNFILNCNEKLGEDYSSDITDIMNIFSLMSDNDVFRNKSKFSGLEENINNIIQSVEKIKNDNKGNRHNSYGTGSSKDIVPIKETKSDKKDSGNFRCAVVVASAVVGACAFSLHVATSTGVICKNNIGRCIQKAIFHL